MMNMLFQERSINGCKHVLLAVHGEGIYNQQKEEMKLFYGEEIFNKAEEELYSSRTFQLIFG